MIEQDPRITEGPTFFQSLYGWMKRAAIEVNAKAPVNNPVLTGDPQAPTPAVIDNDTSIATTAWVRSAMSNIASAAGFASSFGTTSYIKFPSWLGSWVVQWGVTSGTTVASNIAITFPLSFPTACRSALCVSGSSSTTLALPITTAMSATGCTAVFVTPAAGGGGGNTGVGAVSVVVNWVALGN